jgi:site-specific recombinase XerD
MRQGNLDSKRDGVPDPAKLDAMAVERLEAMAETAYFTLGRIRHAVALRIEVQHRESRIFRVEGPGFADRHELSRC